MTVPAGRRLVHFTSPRDWDSDRRLYIGFVDYTGHRAKGGGCHYIAVHSARLTPEELFEILEPRFEIGPGNEPDLVDCTGCGKTFYSDELHFEWHEEIQEYSLLCSVCKARQLSFL